MFNTSAVLVRELPPRNQPNQRTIVGSSQVYADMTTEVPSDPWAFNPWAKWKPTTQQGATQAQASEPRTQAGPMESRLNHQDEKISALQDEIQALRANQQEQHKQIQEAFQNAEEQENRKFAKVEEAMSSMQSTFDKSINATMQAHSRSMGTQFQELKSL